MVNREQVNAMMAELWTVNDSECMEIGPRHAVARRQVGADDLRPGDFVSGPTQFMMADLALWFLVFGAIDRIEPMAVTSELSMRFLRPGVGSTIWARADLERAGRTSVVGTVRIWTEGNEHRPCSTAQGTYALPQEK